MSALAIVLIVVAGLLLLFFVGGLVAARRRRAHFEEAYGESVTAADRALEHARAADKGWDRAELERIAREALNQERAGANYGNLVLVLVDDKPGVAEDRAHFLASGESGEARIVLARGESGWRLDRVE